MSAGPTRFRVISSLLVLTGKQTYKDLLSIVRGTLIKVLSDGDEGGIIWEKGQSQLPKDGNTAKLQQYVIEFKEKLDLERVRNAILGSKYKASVVNLELMGTPAAAPTEVPEDQLPSKPIPGDGAVARVVKIEQEGGDTEATANGDYQVKHKLSGEPFTEVKLRSANGKKVTYAVTGTRDVNVHKLVQELSGQDAAADYAYKLKRVQNNRASNARYLTELKARETEMSQAVSAAPGDARTHLLGELESLKEMIRSTVGRIDQSNQTIGYLQSKLRATEKATLENAA